MQSPTVVAPLPSSDAAVRDADLVALITDGDHEAAFELLLARYEAKVFHLCVAMLGITGQTPEVAQDSLLRVWRALPGYDSTRGAVSTWVYAITRNRCLTELSQRHGAEVSMESPGVREEAERAPFDGSQHDAGAQRLLHQWVDALPQMQRTCLKLYYFEEQSVAEVASLLGLPQGTVKTHLHRARAALLESMQTCGLDSAALWL